jgi:hypothetical protein
MVLRVLNWGKEPIYYVQKSYRKEDGKPATKNVERLGTMEDLISRFGETDPIGEGVTVTVWSDRDSLPPYFIIDDETVLYTRDIGLKLREPFMTNTSGAPKVFSVC